MSNLEIKYRKKRERERDTVTGGINETVRNQFRTFRLKTLDPNPNQDPPKW
jgi:hypothetical protein